MGLSVRLALVTAVAVLPAAGIQLWAELDRRAARRAELDAEALRLALYAASELDRILEGARQVLTALAQSPAVLEDDQPACAAYVAELRRFFPEYGLIAIYDGAGGPVCVPPGRPAFGIGASPSFQASLRDRAFTVGVHTHGRITGLQVLPLLLPVTGPDGTVRRVATASLDLRWLSARLQERGVPPGGSVTVADRHGVILARAPEPETFTGTRIPDAFLPLLHADRPGTREVRSQDGTRRLLGFVPVGARPEGLYVSAGLSTGQAFAALDRSFRATLAMIAAGIASAVLATLAAAQLFIRPPVQALLSATARWRQGDLGARVGTVAGGPTFRRLAAGFDAMAEAVAAREAALRDRDAWLRLAQRAGGVGAWAWDPGRDAWQWSAGLALLLGLEAEPERPARACLLAAAHPEDRAALAAALDAAAREGRLDVVFRVATPPGAAPRWLSARGARAPEGSDRPGWLLGVCLDITARREAELRQGLLMRELDHRARNALAVVRAALRLTRKTDVASFAAALDGRVAALARAHTLLADGHWAGAGLRELVAGEFATFLETSGEEPARRRVRIEGPDVALSPAAAQSLSMALHELCTNAMKYGALSVPEGRVEVGWVLEEAAGALRLTWRERGGPALAGAPERQGFGSRVLDATIGHQLGGGVERRWEEAGLVCVLRVPLARLAGGRVEPNGALLGAEG